LETFLGGKVILHPGDCLDVLATLPENSVDAVVTDPPYLLTSITKRFGADGAAPAQFGSDGRYARLSGGFMNKRWDAPGDSRGLSVFEAWLAGFIAGEGCFRVQAHKNNRYYTCQFSIHLRQDDTPILMACQKRVGGRIVFHDARENKQGVKSAPDVRWLIETRDDCLMLAGILDRVPLFAKKAKDYALWRRALDLWVNTPKGSRWHGPRDVTEMAHLHRELQAIKRWDGSEVDLNFDPFMPPAQAFHYEWARAVHRVLKPGAHLLVFGGSRTYHRMACAVEDAGFEVRDCIFWCFGSGFPKSHDVSKGIDKAAGAEREIVGKYISPDGKNRKAASGGGLPNDSDSLGEWNHPITAPATPEAVQWEGWGTALKPAVEPIVMARKPLSEGTVAANVLRWGTGAINVGACRVATDWAADPTRRGWQGQNNGAGTFQGERVLGGEKCKPNDSGRWPANLIHDGSDEVVRAFPDSAGQQGAVNGTEPSAKTDTAWGSMHRVPGDARAPRGDSGSAARFYYTAKADADDRLGSRHPTVKPVDLMQYLVRLVCPKGGLVFDPFSGTGTTGEAAWREGCSAILIEREAEYQEDIRRRMALALAGPDEKQWASIKARGLTASPGPLFDGPFKEAAE
jgi:DNA modification methylase